MHQACRLIINKLQLIWGPTWSNENSARLAEVATSAGRAIAIWPKPLQTSSWKVSRGTSCECVTAVCVMLDCKALKNWFCFVRVQTTNQFLCASANAAGSVHPWFVEEPLRVSKLQVLHHVALCCIRNFTNAGKLRASKKGASDWSLVEVHCRGWQTSQMFVDLNISFAWWRSVGINYPLLCDV